MPKTCQRAIIRLLTLCLQLVHSRQRNRNHQLIYSDRIILTKGINQIRSLDAIDSSASYQIRPYGAGSSYQISPEYDQWGTLRCLLPIYGTTLFIRAAFAWEHKNYGFGLKERIDRREKFCCHFREAGLNITTLWCTTSCSVQEYSDSELLEGTDWCLIEMQFIYFFRLPTPI